MAASLLGVVLSVASAVAVPGASFVPLLWTLAAGLGAVPSTASLMRHRTEPRWAADFVAVFPALVIFASVLPLVRFLYMALGSLAWPVSTLVLGLGAAALLPLLASASRRVQRWVMAAAAPFVMAGAGPRLVMPT